MSIPVVAFFNNKGGVGKTSLVYHLSWMYADLGARVLAADLDPQADLSAAFMEEDVLEGMWEASHATIAQCVYPLLQGASDVWRADPTLQSDALALLVGDLSLSAFEGQLSDVWPACLDRDPHAFRVMSAFWRIAQQAAEEHRADVILMDTGPNLGAINRAALIAADYVVVPLSPDSLSLQGLRNLGPTLARWRSEWQERVPQNPVKDLLLPAGKMEPAGYIVKQRPVRLDRPFQSHQRWDERIPEVYSEHVLGAKPTPVLMIDDDLNYLGRLMHYRSLMPMAQEARKPVFHLKAADGAIGAHLAFVQAAYEDFRSLARKIAGRISLALPTTA